MVTLTLEVDWTGQCIPRTLQLFRIIKDNSFPASTPLKLCTTFSINGFQKSSAHSNYIVNLLHSLSFLESDNLPMPLFAFSWNNSGMFMSGDTAAIRVIVLGNDESGKYEFPFNPNITVNDKIGNSSYISGVSLDFGDEIEDWKICFTPIMVGTFNVLITDHHFRVLDSYLHFGVTPGRMYPASGILSWKDGVHKFIFGTKAEVLILPKDAFGNNVSSSSEGPVLFNFTLFVLTTSGLPADVLNVTDKG